MALKTGMDYFRLDGKKTPELKMLMLSCGGQKAFGTICSLLQWAVDTNGYYLNWGNKDCRLAFCHEEMVEANFVEELIKIATKKGIFNKEKFDNYQIITNASLQEDFYNCAKRRKELVVNKQFLVEPFVTKFTILAGNVNIQSENVNILQIRRQDGEKTITSSPAFAGINKNISDFNLFKADYPERTDCSFSDLPDWFDISKVKTAYDNSEFLQKKNRQLNLTYWVNNLDKYLKLINGDYNKYAVRVDFTPTKTEQKQQKVQSNSAQYVPIFKKIGGAK